VSLLSYILAIDSGSTGIRAVVFDKQGQIIAKEYQKTLPLTPHPRWVEYDPEELWNSLLEVVTKVFASTSISPQEVVALGICNQRATFCLWERETGKPITNFISWADTRSISTVEKMNKNWKWRLLRKFAWIGRIFGNTMMTATTMLQFNTDHTTSRLKWVLDNEDGLRKRCKNGEILYGTIDSWFVYKLTGGQMHVTDFSNAATGLLNPFQLVWNQYILRIFDIPQQMFPEIKETTSTFGTTDPSLFQGVSIPIAAVAGDQQAALFGQCCFNPGDVKISQGSGAFVDMLVGDKGKLCKRGLLPLIAWVIDERPMYLLEGYVATAGTLIDWLGEGIGLSDTPKILNEFAAKCDDTEGVIFIPTPSGIRFPYFSAHSRATIMGLSLDTHRAHVARAVFEGIAMRIVDILEGVEQDTKIVIKSLKTDGGVSQSDILLQLLADFSNLEVQRAPEADMTATGIAYLAGLSVGFWKDQDELSQLYLRSEPTIFTPNLDSGKREEKRNKWKKALQALLSIG
jgi:glycerol kinase